MSAMKQSLDAGDLDILRPEDVHQVSRDDQKRLMLELIYALRPEEIVDLARAGLTAGELDAFRSLVMRIPYA